MKKNTGTILISIAIGALCIIIALAVQFIPRLQNTQATLDFSSDSAVNTICQLATLKSFYNNVAMFEAEPEGGNKFLNDVMFWPLGKQINVGHKQFWLEYNGTVEIGINADRIRIYGPDKDGIVTVYVPEAEVFDVKADQESLTEPLSNTGWFTSISGEEKIKAFVEAQKNMREEAQNDKTMLARAKKNAKSLIERYIVNMGKEIGIELSIRWIDNPL